MSDNITYNPEEEVENESSQQQTKDTTPKSEWEKYLDSLDEARLKQITDLAKKTTYKIDGADYTRKRIKVKQFNELERLRAKFAKEKDQEKATDYLIDVYAKCAEYYLGIPKETFEEMDWETIKPIIDACNFRSIRGIPNLA